MVEIQIDGKKVEVREGSMVMDAANKLGTYIPHFCYHKKLSIAANCRMCLVEVEKAPKALPACATPVTAGMVVRTSSEKAVSAQKSVMEFLLINHPLDCPICDQGGECQLQDLAVGYGKSASRYEEQKRTVYPKDAGPLISMQEMTRCIQCTRCVRFGQEIAGVMEFGMLNRGEHSEITTFVGKTVDSEVSGNMIDLCPVGALTSKPFRYSARTWELSRRKSVSPHDSIGANLIVQVKNGKVLRVLPLENGDVNECWLSDKDRFAYEGLHTPERLVRPRIKQDGVWRDVEWQTALEYIAHGMRNIRHEHGAEAIGMLATPYATLEELGLLRKVADGLGTDNLDFRTRQSDFSLDGKVTPWLGMSLANFGALDQIFVIGSFLRKDHPLLSLRLRSNVKSGAILGLLNATDDDLLMPVSHKLIAAPGDWVALLQEVVGAIAAAKNLPAPAGAASEPGESARALAQALLAEGKGGIFLGNAAAQHPQASALHALAQWIAEATGATLGYLTEGGNRVGGYLAGALPGNGLNAQQMFAQPRKAYLLWNAEPELDMHHPAEARAALQQAEMVVVMSAYQHGDDYADVMLPIAPYTETSGTFVNCEGRAQSFNGATRPLGDARPGWKVLRVLGNLLGLSGFDYETSESVREEMLGAGATLEILQGRLSNHATALALPDAAARRSEMLLQRVADVPIHFSDPVARRSPPLLETRDGADPRAVLSLVLAQRLGVASGERVRVSQGAASAILPVAIDERLPVNVVRVAAAHASTATLGAMFGDIDVEKV